MTFVTAFLKDIPLASSVVHKFDWETAPIGVLVCIERRRFDSGNAVVIEAADDEAAEELARAVTGALGAAALGAFYPMSSRQLKRCAVLRTLTQTLAIGRAIRLARDTGRDIFADLVAVLRRRDDRPAHVLFDGRITDVFRETRDGWHWGRATLRGIADPADELTIDIQNEFTVARRNGETVAIVPDLIAVLDRETGGPLTGEMLSYGQRVKVLGYAADAMLRPPRSLAVVGPAAFGMDEPFRAVEDLAAGSAAPVPVKGTS